MRAPSFPPMLAAALMILPGCIPTDGGDTAGRATPSAPPPRLDADAAAVAVVEDQPVWTARQVMPSARPVDGTVHIVQPGETLGGIANRSGAGVDAIARANGLAPPFTIRAGQRLTIPAAAIVVGEGETGIGIALAYGVPWSRIVAVNGLAEPFALRRGQRLLLPDEAEVRARPLGTRDLERRAAAFRIDIDDVLTGGQPATASDAPPVRTATAHRPLPANVPAATPQALAAGGFAWPAKGTILARFGAGESGSRNNGIDIAVPAGTPIRASADGVVAYAGNQVAVFGGLVLITHGDGWVSAYGHASRVDVVRGQKVRRGDVIGLTGDSGYASQPKLHFELRQGRQPVNP